MTVAISHHYADANGIRLHYAAAGSGPLVLFLHGFPEFWYAWWAQLAEFGRDRLAVAPDQRGHNLSDKPAGVDAYKAKHLIADVRALALALGRERFALVAHDWGGAIAWSFAIAHPEMLDKLVIVNAPHPIAFARELGGNPVHQRASSYMNLFRDAKAERVMSEDKYRRLARMSVDAWNAGSDERRAYLEAWAQPGALSCMLNWYRASPFYPPTGNDLGAARLKLDPRDFVVRVPTLVIWGMRDDFLLPSLLDGLDECVPDLRIERIPEGTHWVIHEQPERVNALIRAFLDPGGREAE
ncbi:MAG TPA: alpha/beta hydrolase [Burkholderiales bacterium]|nr:alpha/beta hydrolase [Burkholderiales bacterium]